MTTPYKQRNLSVADLRRLSDLPAKAWQKERVGVVELPPYNLKMREHALQDAYPLLLLTKKTFWLTGGSLLGAVRNNDFIAWDDDVDMDMLEKDFVQIMYKLKEDLISVGFVVRLIDTKEYPKMSFFKYGQKISLGALHRRGDYLIRPHYRYPAKYFNRKKTIVFKAMEFSIPSPVDGFLTYVYGDWRTPKKAEDEDEYTTPGVRSGKRISWFTTLLNFIKSLKI